MPEWDASSGGALYDRIGTGYRSTRRQDPRIAQRIRGALGDARTVLNVGAGSGSYEPVDRGVVAVEPSRVMRDQRSPGAPPCIAAAAEALPFPDRAFDAAMAILSDHHWSDPLKGLRELRRVAGRVVVFQWDQGVAAQFWLVRDYLPEFTTLGRGRPGLQERARALGARVETVAIPWDCADGFFHAYWRRPEAYLDERVRRGTSVWARAGQAAEARAVRALRADLASGAWHRRNAGLLAVEEADLGARLLIADRARGGTAD